LKYKHWRNLKTNEVIKAKTQLNGFVKITPKEYGDIMRANYSWSAWKRKAELEQSLKIEALEKAAERDVVNTVILIITFTILVILCGYFMGAWVAGM